MMRRRNTKRAGISLLEVLTALAIFMLSIVVISQMVNSGARTADRSRRLTQAGVLCEARMSAILAGVPTDDGDDPGWQYDVSYEPQDWTQVQVNNSSGTGQAASGNVTGLTVVHVTVRYGNEVEYTLTRTMLDPSLRTSQADPASTSTPGGSSGGSGGGKSGGSGKSAGKGGSSGGMKGGAGGGIPSGGSGAPPATGGGKTGGKP